MSLAKMDQKGRIMLPIYARKKLALKAGQAFFVDVEDGKILLSKADVPTIEKDPVLRDIILNPGKSKVRITKKLLDQLDEEWYG